MKLRVAIPDNPAFARLTERAAEVCRQNDFELLPVSTDRCADLLHRHFAELALITPEAYGSAVGSADYRIVRGPALMLEGFCKQASIYFRPGAADIASCAIAEPNEFVSRMGGVVLGEKFQLPLTIAAHKGSPTELLRRFDAVLAMGSDDSLAASLDISEEWQDLTGEALPLLQWVCRPEEMPANIEEIVGLMAAPDLPENEVISDTPDDPDGLSRQGVIHWRWNDASEAALNKTIEMLFYLQFVPAIAAVKIFGRDPFE